MTISPYEPNNIYCGDNAAMLAALPDASIDLTVTSPPYDDMDDNFNPIPARGLRQYNGYTWDFKAIAEQLYRVTKPGGVVVWVVGDPTIDGSESLASSLQKVYFRRVGFNLHDTMIWNKGTFTAVGSLVTRYAPVFEYMLVLSRGLPEKFNPLKDRINKTAGDLHHGKARQPNGSMKPLANIGREIQEHGQRFNVWDIRGETQNRTNHPAPFPEALARDHIISWSNPGDIVLDPFSGSGTTAKMAKMLQRQFIGFDISQEYVDLARRRIAAAPVPLPFVMDEPVVKVEQVKLFCD